MGNEANLHALGSFLWSAGIICLTVYLSLTALLFIFQPSFIYFPDKMIYANPSQLGLDYEEVNFNASDGTNLNGWFIPGENPEKVLLFCHGNAGNISHRLESLHIFNRLGLSTFIFDYRGYGKSSGKPSEEGTYSDGEGAWNYLLNERKIAPGNIIIFGRSLGASVAARIAERNQPKALIIESAFISVRAFAADLYPYLPVRFITRFSYNTAKYVKGIKAPLLVIHSRDDEIIPYHHGVKLFEIARQPKMFLEIQGGHNDGFYLSKSIYIDGIEGFLEKYVFKD